MAEDITPTTTGASLFAQAPDVQRKLWEKGFLVAEQSADYFQDFEGGSSTGIIWTKTDTSKGNGQKITFSTLSGFYNEPKRNDSRFDDPTDFETSDIGSFDLIVDFARNAWSSNERAEEFMGIRGELTSSVNVEMGKWLGRLKTEEMFGQIQLVLPEENHLYANGKTLDTIVTADTLDWDNIVVAGQAMKPLGGEPANVASNGAGQEIWRNTVVATETALTSLKLDPSYKTLLGNADTRGDMNTIFRGGYQDVDGHIIKPYNPIDHDGIGAVGSFFNSHAFLGTAITAGTTTFAVTGGGNATDGAKTAKLYFKYFPNYAYVFTGTGAITPATATRYLLIYNRTGADAGKFGMYSYTTGNNGNTITIVNRLAAAASGAAVTTLGNVTWNTGQWLNKHTDAHPSGSLIMLCNANGVPIGETAVMGRAAAYRGYGKYRGYRSEQTYEGGFIFQKFVTSVFGQTLRKDRKGRVPAVIRVTHALQYPGINFPDVT